MVLRAEPPMCRESVLTGIARHRAQEAAAQENCQCLRSELPGQLNFSKSTSAGALDANKQVQYIAGMCPRTKTGPGGMSQGAGAIDLITIGKRTIWFFTSAPLPDTMVNHVAAIAVFGNPSRDIATLGPLTKISPLYGSKAIDLCADGDPYCSKAIRN